MCHNKIEYMFQVETKISKESEMTSQDCQQNMHASENASLHQLLSDFLDQSPKKDKAFIKNELKIKPLLEVNKHAFKDECSPLAIVDFKLLQAAFKHFSETSDCASTKDDLQPFSEASNRWKESYFLSSKDLNATGASEESDLEKALSELQMSEISNNISDPEVLDFCNNEFSCKSLSVSLYSTVPEEYLELTPPQHFPNGAPFIHHLGTVDEGTTAEPNPQLICENGVIPENLKVPVTEVVHQKSKAIKRKKTIFGKRKKCKKKNSLSMNNVPKSILARNVSSTESSEIFFSMSETQKNKLRKEEKDLCTAEKLRQNSLISQKQQPVSSVPISLKNKAIAESESKRSKINVDSTESSEYCLSMSTQENKLRKDEKDLCTAEKLRQNSLISQEQQPVSSVPISIKNKAIAESESKRRKRNVGSTESSEYCLSMSTQENKLRKDEKDLCTAEKLQQNSLISQEQQPVSIVLNSPKNKAIAKSNRKRSKRNVSSTESPKNCFSMSKTQKNELGRSEKDLFTAQQLRQNCLIAQEQQPVSFVPISPKNKAIAESERKSSKRNVSSTESSEYCFSMSETQANKLGIHEKDLCTAEKLQQNSLIAQEQQPVSSFPISPKNKAIAESESKRSKRNVSSTESFEYCLSMSTQENQLRKNEKDLCTAEKLQQNSLIVQEQQPVSSVPISPKNKAIAKSNRKRSKRNVSSTESPENCFSMSETQENELGRPEKDLCTAQELRQNSLISQQQLSGTVPISPKNKAIIQRERKRSKKKLKKSLKTIIKFKIPKSPRFSKKDHETPPVKLFNSPLQPVISKVQNPSVSLHTSEVEGCDKNTSKVVKSPKTAQTLFKISEQLDKNDVNSSISPLGPSNSNIIETGGSPEEDKHDNEKQSVLSQDSHPQSQKESMDSGNAWSGVDCSQQEISEKSVIESLGSRYKDDLSELLDFEGDDHLSDLDESESLSSPVPDAANEEFSTFSEELPLREGTSDDVSNTCDAEVACREVSSSQTNSKDPLTAKPKIASPARSSRGYGSISEDMLGREGGRKRPMVSSDDSDSTSDSELSFKRRNNISPLQHQYRNVHTEQVPPSSSTKLDQVPEQYFTKINNILQHIRDKCENHEISGAVHTANKYLDISGNTLDRMKIFKEIFHSIKKSVCFTNNISEEPVKETFDKLKAFIENPEARCLAKGLCSNIIQEYFQHSLLIKFALHLCTFCQTEGISISQRAVGEYARDVMSRNAPMPVLLKFLDYVRHVCKLSFPKPLFLYVLERITRGKECYLLPDFSLFCDLLCTLESHELENAPLQKFMDVCVRNDCWDQIARLFTAWATKKYFPEVLLRALQPSLKEAGMLFKKFAAAVYGNGELGSQCRIFFKVTGVILMLDTYHRGLNVEGKNSYFISAIDVLHTLHKYGVNFFNLEESWCNSEVMRKYLCADSSSMILSAFHVVLIAIDLCLRLERPKTAFQIFTGYSVKLREEPEILSQSIKLEIRMKYFNLFLEVTRLLHHSDPLDMSAFRELISTLEQAGTFLNDLKECTDVNFKVVEQVFNDLLIAYMNKSLISIVSELYQYTNGRCETLLPIRNQVLRGLVVTFAKYQKMVDAQSLFNLGCHRNVYSFEKPQLDNLPWCVTIMSHWTSYEMRFIIERFLQKLFPLLAKRKSKIKFEDWFTVKIAFREIPCIPPKINCLIESFPSALARACNILRCIHSDFTWAEYEDYILLSPNHVYSYWRKNFAEFQGTAFSVLQSRPVAFGLDADSANVNSSLTVTPENYHSNHSSPTKNHLPGEVSSTTSDHGHSLNRTNSFDNPDMSAKRRISFSSSDRSSSRTPESRLSAGESRFPQPELKRPFPVRHTSSTYESHPGSPAVSRFHIEGPANKRCRTDSSDMSELSNFVCSKISPNRNPPLFHQSPIISHQSPQKTIPLHSQGMASPFKRSSEKFQSPKRQVCNGFSPRGVSAMQNNSSSFQSPKQHGSEYISPGISNSMHIRDTRANDFIKEYRNMAAKPSLLISPPVSHFRKVSPWVSDKSDLPLNDENLNVSSPKEHVNLNIQRLSKPFQPKTKKIVKKVTKKAGTNKAQNPHKVVSKNTATVKKINPTTSSAVIPTQQKTLTAVCEPVCVSSSLINHKPELSVFTVPPRSKVTAKRRLQVSKEADHPKLPPYRIPTPCKQLRVVRPVTPIVRSSSLRSKTPLSFQCVPRASQHIKRPLPPVHATSNEKKGLLHRAINAPKGKIAFENFTVSFQSSSSNRVVITPPVASRNTAVALKMKQGFGVNSATTKTIEEPSTSAIPVTNVKGVFAKPMVKRIKMVQARSSTKIPENDFEKIMNFLKSKVLLKCGGIKEDELVNRATMLANTFIENNAVQRLDTKIMKQLVEFAKSIY